MESDADRLAALRTVGEQITLGGAAVWGMWSNAYAETLGGATRVPALLVRESDCAGVTQATQVVRGGVTYRVANVESDGSGYVTLQLQRAS